MRSTARMLTLGLLAATTVWAREKDAPTAPGSYEDWNEDLDRVEIAETFRLSDYSSLTVGPFDTAATPLPEKDDNTYEPVQRVLQNVLPSLIEGLREGLEGRLSVSAASEASEGERGPAGGLRLRGTVLQMDPGSRAARYWASFGAGAARTQLEGELVDLATDRVLLRFTQERRSGVGLGGGSYVNLLERNLRAIGKDLGNGLRQF